MSIWRSFNKFLIKLDIRTNMAWEQKAALFGAHLIENGIKSSTLKSYFSAIKKVLVQDNYHWDDSKVLLNALVRSCKISNDIVKTRLPISGKLLDLILFEIERKYRAKKNMQPYLEILYKAMLLLMYYGMMRIGEVATGDHPIRATDIHIGKNKNKILVVLYTSKTHGLESPPHKIKISAGSSFRENQHREEMKKFFCPFTVLRQFARVRGPYEEEDEPFFIFKDKSAVKPSHIRTILRSSLKQLGLDSKLYNTQSLKAGRTVDLAKFGYDLDRIRKIGRWKSNAVYSYLKN